jgi:hypothetical protein
MNGQIGARMNSQPRCLMLASHLKSSTSYVAPLAPRASGAGARLILFEAGLLNFDEFRCADNTCAPDVPVSLHVPARPYDGFDLTAST